MRAPLRGAMRPELAWMRCLDEELEAETMDLEVAKRSHRLAKLVSKADEEDEKMQARNHKRGLCIAANAAIRGVLKKKG